MIKRALTGVKPTGAPHLGNLLAAIQPSIELSKLYESHLFIANYHALTTVDDPKQLTHDTYSIAASYLALGFDAERSFFYRQSDIPEIFELSWILACMTPKGFMNRAHAYKDAVAKNLAAAEDSDANVNMGLYSYPVLMSADILMFNVHLVPVGQDQKQHVEFARDIAQRFNRQFGELFVLPEAILDENLQTIVGLDGRKMSKSYNNTIPLFSEEKSLQKLCNRIVTNSQAPEESKNPDESHIFALHRLFVNSEAEQKLREKYLTGGLGWGQAKKDLFECLNERLKQPRQEYYRLMADLGHLENVLRQGALKARAKSSLFIKQIRDAIGIVGISEVKG